MKRNLVEPGRCPVYRSRCLLDDEFRAATVSHEVCLYCLGDQTAAHHLSLYLRGSATSIRHKF